MTRALSLFIVAACVAGLHVQALAQQHLHEPSAAVTGDLGVIDFASSGAPPAQPAFIRGVLLLHSFEFEAARQAFLDAQHIDPSFALAYWGEALSYNKPIWGEQDIDAARAALGKLAPTPEARRAKAPTAREKAWLGTAESLYGAGDKRARDAAYSAALGEMARNFPQDLDARAFYALSLMGLTGVTRDHANYMRAAAEAEEVYRVNPRHPGALHYLIHAYDDPVHAPLGLRAARVYGEVAHGASHAQHMPSHIFFALGMWDDAIASNIASMQTARAHGAGGYHAMLWLAYAYLQQGRNDDAQRIIALIGDDVAKHPDRRDSRNSLAYARAMWLVETGGAGLPGAWDPVASDGIGSIEFLSAHDFARGIVGARQDRIDIAAAALLQLQGRIEAAKVAGAHLAADRLDTTTSGEIEHAQLLATTLEGAIAFAKGERDSGLARVRAAVTHADGMEFEYGPPWSVKPLDELAGDLLLSLGRREEAAAAYRKSLQAHPNRRLSSDGVAAGSNSGGTTW